MISNTYNKEKNMKKYISIFTLMLIVCVLIACIEQTQSQKDTQGEDNTIDDTIDDTADAPQIIQVDNGLSDLKRLREILSSADEYDKEEYKEFVRGAFNQRDLEDFLETIDLLSYIPLGTDQLDSRLQAIRDSSHS